jgi:predicted Fe-S protein YdhL (DUF1289 family)
MSDEIESPCIGVCQLDERQICKGCFRAMDEIMAWRDASRETRLIILRAATQRKSSNKNE